MPTPQEEQFYNDVMDHPELLDDEKIQKATSKLPDSLYLSAWQRHLNNRALNSLRDLAETDSHVSRKF
jgi:hypothetical protein